MDSSAFPIAAMGISKRATNAIIDFITDRSNQLVNGLLNWEPFNRIEMIISIGLIEFERMGDLLELRSIGDK
jgi:hypothetical protein